MKEVQSSWPAGIKRTKQREGVLAVLEKAEQPLSASDICSQMGAGKDAAWLSTIYRVLEIFVRNSVVIKTNVMNSEMAVYELNRYKHKHYAVCMNCRKIIPMNNCPLEKFTPKLEDEDFQIMGHNLEVYGFCKDCNRKE